MKRSFIAGMTVLALFASACGGSSDAVPPERSAPGTAPENDSIIDDGPASEAASTSALQLIDELGSDDAATDALIIAMERGYSGDQILDAVADDRLLGDGTIDGESPAGAELGLVLYEDDGDGGDEESLGADHSVEVVMVAYTSAPPQTPIEQLRRNASVERGVGDPAAGLMLTWLRLGFTPADVIEMLIFGVDGADDYPDDPEGPIVCARVVDELYCPGGERFPAPDQPNEPDEEVTAASTPTPEAEPAITEPDEAAPQQLSWASELTPNPEFVDNPVAGSFELTRTAGTDDFQLTATTTDAKAGTFTTDGFDEVECTAEWSSTFVGTGTFWDINDLGIEFEGQITRQIVYVAGPCDSVLEPDVSDFSGVVVFVTDDGIEFDFNAWSVTLTGPPPSPVTR